MGLLSNRISRESLKPGDHIYSWRTAYIYSHHGIYVGEDKVIHFTRGRGQEVGTGTMLDLLLVSSLPNRSQLPCTICQHLEEGNGVVSSCLDCFLDGGVLYRFEYDVNPALFLAKARGGTCTLAVSDPNEIVVHRANYLLTNGFGFYNIFQNNCEDFAIYCKTGRVAVVGQVLGQSGQAVSIIGGPLAAVLSTSLRLVTTNLYGMAAMGVAAYCAGRFAGDIGKRKDVTKVEVEDLATMLATGRLQVAEAPLRLVTTNLYGMAATAVTAYCGGRFAGDIGKRKDVTKGKAEDLATMLATGRLQVAEAPLRLVTTNLYGMAATAVTAYCSGRFAGDIGKRKDVIKVEAEDLPTRLATGRPQVAETMAVVPALTAR